MKPHSLNHLLLQSNNALKGFLDAENNEVLALNYHALQTSKSLQSDYRQYLNPEAKRRLDLLALCCLTGRQKQSRYLMNTEQSYSLKDAFIALGIIDDTNTFAFLKDTLTEATFIELMVGDAYLIFRTAAANGSIHVLELLEQELKDHVEKMIKADHFGAFKSAASNNQLAVFHYLVKKAGEHRVAMIENDDYAAFRFAAHKGRIAIIKAFKEIDGIDVRALLRADNFGAFRLAIEAGQLAVIDELVNEAARLGLLDEMLESGKCAGFRTAVIHGQLAVIDYFFKRFGHPRCITMLRANDYMAFRSACRHQQTNVLDDFIERAPNDASAMVEAKNFGAMRGALIGGDNNMLDYLLRLNIDSQLDYLINLPELYKRPDVIKRIVAYLETRLSTKTSQTVGGVTTTEIVLAPNLLKTALAFFESLNDKRYNGLIDAIKGVNSQQISPVQPSSPSPLVMAEVMFFTDDKSNPLEEQKTSTKANPFIR